MKIAVLSDTHDSVPASIGIYDTQSNMFTSIEIK